LRQKLEQLLPRRHASRIGYACRAAYAGRAPRTASWLSKKGRLLTQRGPRTFGAVTDSEVQLGSIAVFRVTVEPLEDACVMRATGELDSSTADRLRGPLDAARADGVTTLLDLSGVSFMDSAGLGVLLDAARPSNPDDWAWFIVRPSPVVQRLVALTGVAARLPIVEPQRGVPARAAVRAPVTGQESARVRGREPPVSVSLEGVARARRGRGRAARPS